MLCIWLWGVCAPAMWPAWWLHCGMLAMIWSSQLAACQRSILHSSDIICGPIGMRSGSSCMSAPARHHQPMHVCVHMTGFFRPFNMQFSMLRLPMLHTAMWQLHLFRTGCHGLLVDLGRGNGVARVDRACMLCGRCPGDE